jgi:Fibronectin type III domain
MPFLPNLAPHLKLNLLIEKENLMPRIRLNLNRLSVNDKIAKGRQIVTAMTNHPSFPTPSPSLTDITAALEELDKAFAEVQAARSDVTTRVVAQDDAEVKVDQMLTQIGGYVESIAGKDDKLISSAGMETKSTPTAPSVPSVPQGVSALAGERDGEIDLSWRPISNARSYTIEFSLDPATPASWAHIAIAASANKTLTNLKSGTRHWFRVAAINTLGQSGWSEHATKIVP